MTAVLGLETSCDETAAAIVSSPAVIESTVVASQIDLHERFGGVVPELASRAHLDALGPVIDQALTRAGRSAAQPRLDAVAATYGPGLVGALLVGVSHAKALALGWGVPYVGVNHLEAHLFAALLEGDEPAFPLVVVLVSGGHTMIVAMHGPGHYEVLGETLDDAAGEAFDKVARYLGLGFPGGPAIDKAAESGNPEAFALPRPLLDQGLDLSFSGLKTALVRTVERNHQADNNDLAASFQAAVVDVLVHKARRAVRQIDAAGVCIGGGVAANSALRAAIVEMAAAESIPAYLPSRAMCTDNAAMVAAAGLWRLDHDGPSSLDLGVDAALGLVN